MTQWRTRNERNYPYRVYTPDLHTKNPGFGIKAGIGGAVAQPAEYVARYAWERYGGTEKTRALILLAQKEWKERFFRWRMYNYGNASFSKKKFRSSSSNTKFQKGPKYRTSKQSRILLMSVPISMYCALVF